MSRSKAPSLYSTKKTVLQLTSLPDALNRQLKIQDFVTAVFRDGELTLFQVERFEQHTNDYFMDYSLLDDITAAKWSAEQGKNVKEQGLTLMRSETIDYIILKRVRGTTAYYKINTSLNAKDVLKTSKQVAYADPQYVFLHYLSN